MTYCEQLKIENINKEIFNHIITTIQPKDFIDFYISHTVKETCEYFGIRNKKQLNKILIAFNYDFSTVKPSKLKNKPASRSHESYVNGGKKSAQTQRNNWSSKSTAEKNEWSQKQVIAHNTAEFKERISEINKTYYASLTDEQKQQLLAKKSKSNKNAWQTNKSSILSKAYLTKTNNQSFNSSEPEENYYIYLCNKYGQDNIIRQYTDERYPFACDFYIKSSDTFIELNLSWTHGGHHYDKDNEADKRKLAIWQEKAKQSDYYKKAIYVWTDLDVRKYQTAKQNNINYKCYYTEAELYE